MHMPANNSPKVNTPDFNNEEQVVVIGKQFDFEGNLSGTGAVILSGKMEGNIISTQVIIEKEARAIGNISCQQIDISGYVQGVVEVVDAVIRATATVEGDLHYSSIAIENGGRIIGKLKQTPKKSSPITIDIAKEFVTPKKTAPEFIQIAFPVDLTQKLRTHESHMGAYLTMTDGGATPSWVKLNQDKLGLTANSVELKRLEDTRSQVELRLHVGSQYFDFKLPA